MPKAATNSGASRLNPLSRALANRTSSTLGGAGASTSAGSANDAAEKKLPMNAVTLEVSLLPAFSAERLLHAFALLLALPDVLVRNTISSAEKYKFISSNADLKDALATFVDPNHRLVPVASAVNFIAAVFRQMIATPDKILGDINLTQPDSDAVDLGIRAVKDAIVYLGASPVKFLVDTGGDKNVHCFCGNVSMVM